MGSINETLAKNISALRKKKGFTQESLAERLGISYQAVSKWETAKSTPDITLLTDLADAFDCSIDYLFSKEEKPDLGFEKNLWVNDGKIRAVIFEGAKLLQASNPDDFETLKKYTIELVGDTKNIECSCNVYVNGSVSDGVNANGEVTICGHLSGGVNSLSDVTVGFNLTGGVNAEGEVTIGGNMTGGINTDSDIVVKGNISAQKIDCKGNMEVGGNIEADKIIGNVTCNTLGRCDKVEGSLTINKASE